MNFIIDFLLVAVVVLGVWLGYRAGFIKMLAKPVRFFAVLIFAFSFAKSFSAAVVAPLIGPSITGYVSSHLYESASFITAENAAEELPTLIKISATLSGVDIEQLVHGTSGEELIERVVSELATPVINIVAVIISFIALYIIGRIVAFLLVALVNAFFSKGALGVFNKTLGCIFSTLFSIIIAWALAVMIGLVFHMPAMESNRLIKDFDGGIIYTFFNTYNPMELLLSF